jgi:hypothetical protein
MLEQHEEPVAENVTANLLDRHIRPVFLGSNPMQTSPVQTAGAQSGTQSAGIVRH